MAGLAVVDEQRVEAVERRALPIELFSYGHPDLFKGIGFGIDQ